MRTRFALAVPLLAAVLALGCESYPVLTEPLLPNFSGGTGTGGSTGGTGDGDTTGPNPSDNSNTNDNSADPNDSPALSGEVARKICDRVVVIAFTAPVEEEIVFRSPGSSYQFWEVGEGVTIDPADDKLVNLDRDVRASSTPLGEIVVETALDTVNQTTLTVTTHDGSLWLFSDDDYAIEVRQWVSNGDAIVVTRNAGGQYYLINVRRCTATPASKR